MDKKELDKKIEEAAKSLLSYCITRTSDHFEAEDLAQDIILEVYRSAEKLKNVEAFYGFMWAVAGNVYKNWCKTKAKMRNCEFLSELPDVKEELEETDETIFLLRRELSLLSEKYRKAAVLYYIENKSCLEISEKLSISESMVKYLLFKSRQILKEGITMERNLGTQSYNPKGLSLMFWGNGANRYYNLCDSKISQNILFACYNDNLTAEQISLEIGVSLPYMEDKLNELCDYEVLKKDGNKYYTNIAIFTKDFTSEVDVKTKTLRENIANIVESAVKDNEKELRSIASMGADAGNNVYSWQMSTFLLYRAIIELFQNKIQIVYPKDKFGTECFVWGEETAEHRTWLNDFCFGICNTVNENGDYIQFMDFPINGEMVHHYHFNRQNVTNVFLDVAKGTTESFSDNDKAVLADMVRRGYIKNEDGVKVNCPVYSKEQHEKLKTFFQPYAEKIADEAEKLKSVVEKILKEHIPTHLKKYSKELSYLRLFEDTISAPIKLLYERSFLSSQTPGEMLPTTYVILK